MGTISLCECVIQHYNQYCSIKAENDTASTVIDCYGSIILEDDYTC